jgi:hypothetical protein
MVTIGNPLTRNFILTLSIGISFGFGFAYMFMSISKYNGSEFSDIGYGLYYIFLTRIKDV